MSRYAIDRSTDLESIFDIDANTGAIMTGKVLDRETAGWHNITVLAMEAGEAWRGAGSGGCLAAGVGTALPTGVEVTGREKAGCGAGCEKPESDISPDSLKILLLTHALMREPWSGGAFDEH